MYSWWPQASHAYGDKSQVDNCYFQLEHCNFSTLEAIQKMSRAVLAFIAE
jgi:hypothetical protein